MNATGRLLLVLIGLAVATVSYASSFSISYTNNYGCIPNPTCPWCCTYWKSSCSYRDNISEGFASSLSNISTFWFEAVGSDLESELWYADGHIEDDIIDEVDIHFHSGHGYPNALAMYDYLEFMEFSDMTLGDFQTEWLAMYSCYVVSKTNPWSEFGPSFSIGLHGVLGGYDEVFCNSSHAGVGDAFADNLRDGDTMKTAWLDATDGGDNYPGIIYTGEGLSDCWTRVDSETFHSVGGQVYSDPDGSAWCRYRRAP